MMLDRIMQWLGVAEQPPVDQLDYAIIERFRKGTTIPKLSSGAGDILAEQRRIEEALREYLDRQEELIDRLEQALAERDWTN